MGTNKIKVLIGGHMYIYDGHLGDLYISPVELDWEDLFCETCGDSDTFIAKTCWQSWSSNSPSTNWTQIWSRTSIRRWVRRARQRISTLTSLTRRWRHTPALLIIICRVSWSRWPRSPSSWCSPRLSPVSLVWTWSRAWRTHGGVSPWWSCYRSAWLPSSTGYSAERLGFSPYKAKNNTFALPWGK